MAKITVSMGGRAAEEVVMHTMTNGASQDIQEATNIARNMVAMFGMSDEFGMMALGSVRNQYLDGGYGLDCAQETAAIMDKEVKIILDQCYKAAVELLKENLEDMHKVVEYLLQKETITGGEMVAIIEGRDPAWWRTPTHPPTPRQSLCPGILSSSQEYPHGQRGDQAPLPPQEDEGSDAKPEDQASDDSDKPQSPAQPEEGNDSDSEETKE